jgi:imidazolonepropionase-like amidohydrolase
MASNVEVAVIRRSLVLVALLVAGAAVPGAQPRPSPGVIAITGGTVVTVTKGTIPNGTVVIRDGKIAAVGANLDVPDGAEVVDARGKFVSPGIIDAHSHIAADSINEGGTTVSSMTGIEDVFDPTDVNILRDLAGGLTTANVLHGSANPIGGKNAVIKLRWGKTRTEELLFEGAMPGIKFALGENPKRNSTRPGPPRYPNTRLGVEYVIRDAFTRAKAYQGEWKEYERRRAAGETVLVPRRDLQLEPLVEILEGKRLVHAHCYRADEILMLIRLADEMGFKIATFQHVLEGYKVAKEIAAHGAGASTFSDWWGYKIEAIDAIPYNAALMTRKGVLVSVNSDSAEHARRLNTEAAKSIKWGGLTEDEALALVTINPAKQLRVDNRVGSLEPGKDADVVIWTAHPLSSYAIVDRTYIDGTVYYDRLAAERQLTDAQREKDSLRAAEAPARRTTTDDSPNANGENGNGNGNGHVNGNGISNGNGGSSGTPAVPPERQSPAARAQNPADSSRVLAVVNARIHPISGPTIERGTIVVRGGRIEAVGAAVTAPAGAQIVDAAGGDIYPGWINARSTIGLAEPGAGGYDDVDEMLPFNPQLRPFVAFNSDSDSIPVARANGVTTVAVTPSGGILGGQIAVMNLDGWTWEENIVKQVAGVAFQFPTMGGGRRGGGGQSAPGPERTYEELKKERDGKLDETANLLQQARAYAKAGPNRATDWVLQALGPIVERRLPLITRVDRESDIRDAVAFADRVGVRIVISGGLEAPLVASLLSEKKIPVILGPVLTLPGREDHWHAATYQAAGQLVKAGVKVAFATGDADNARLLPYHAAESVAWGLDRNEAIKALTINAAEILGVSDVLGTIEPGKIANLVISNGDPLEIRTAITHVIINGRAVGLMNKHQALYDRYSARQ